MQEKKQTETPGLSSEAGLSHQGRDRDRASSVFTEWVSACLLEAMVVPQAA